VSCSAIRICPMELAFACWRLWSASQLPRSFACRSKIAVFGCPPSMVEKIAWDCQLSDLRSLRAHSKRWPGVYPWYGEGYSGRTRKETEGQSENSVNPDTL